MWATSWSWRPGDEVGRHLYAQAQEEEIHTVHTYIRNVCIRYIHVHTRAQEEEMHIDVYQCMGAAHTEYVGNLIGAGHWETRHICVHVLTHHNAHTVTPTLL